MESLACGTPVIAFRSGALAEIVEHGRTGFLVKDGCEMAEAIRAAGTLDSNVCRQAAKERFAQDRMIEKYFRVYDHLACGAPECIGQADPSNCRNVFLNAKSLQSSGVASLA